MTAKRSFAYQQAWYPLAPLQDLDLRRPQPLTLLGEPYVIWKPPLPGSPGRCVWIVVRTGWPPSAKVDWTVHRAS